MHLKKLELNGFKSFANTSEFVFDVPIIAIVGPNGSGKSNVVEAIRFVLGEQSVKSMRGKTGSDLIFKGSKEISKMSRASVNIVFDNTDRVFHLHQDDNQRINVDFDEVEISRQVYADGTNKYLINGTEVRMKDVRELIASVNIGASGHHIISQGEADRYLNANAKDRRVLIEEALGLKVYQYRIKESERKLERALANIRESELLRRELAPHLRFLKKQVEKIERAKELRTELYALYQNYFAQEDYLIKHLETDLDRDRTVIQSEYSEVMAFLDAYTNQSDTTHYEEESQMGDIQTAITKLTTEQSAFRQELGSVEGMLAVLKKQATPESTSPRSQLAFGVVETFITTILNRIDSIKWNTIEDVRETVSEIRNTVTEFIAQPVTTVPNDTTDEIAELEDRKRNIEQRITNHEQEVTHLRTQYHDFEQALEQRRTTDRESERQYYEYGARKKELDVKRSLVAQRDEMLGHRIQAKKEELEEARVLLGINEIEYESVVDDASLSITSETQERLRRDIERSKIRLEDMGGGSGVEVMNEYDETLERDQFLEREIADMTTSIQSLESIIADLKESLNGKFDVGIQKINDQFNHFFKLMFGGGQASLAPVVIKKRKSSSDDESGDMDTSTDDGEEDYGIDINVKLPRKKVSDLDMLSGGERSLTSIALLFALSQVNPPPFLVLDETDAALDEANSQKYGDMIESLAKYSQLILVTHNRETMSRAHTLFGVTLGRADASTTLSLRLEDAEKYAK